MPQGTWQECVWPIHYHIVYTKLCMWARGNGKKEWQRTVGQKNQKLPRRKEKIPLWVQGLLTVTLTQTFNLPNLQILSTFWKKQTKFTQNMCHLLSLNVTVTAEYFEHFLFAVYLHSVVAGRQDEFGQVTWLSLWFGRHRSVKQDSPIWASRRVKCVETRWVVCLYIHGGLGARRMES